MKSIYQRTAAELAQTVDGIVETIRGNDPYDFIPTLEWIALILTQKSAEEAVKEARVI